MTDDSTANVLSNILLRVVHITQYHYPVPVHNSLNEVRLKPRRCQGQRLEEFRMETDPPASYLAEHVDAFGNPTTILGIQRAHSDWSVRVSAEVRRWQEPAAVSEPGMTLTEVLAHLREDRSPAGLDARQHTSSSPLLPLVPDLWEQLNLKLDWDWDVAVLGQTLNHFIHQEFAYQPGITEVSTPLTQVIKERAGVCQDFAHLAIAAARILGIPARYVSGYMETVPPPGVPRLIGVDATHAWFALYDPLKGWLQFDPTNDAQPDQRYITLAWGRDYSDVAPIQGVVQGGGNAHTLSVSVDVERLTEPED